MDRLLSILWRLETSQRYDIEYRRHISDDEMTVYVGGSLLPQVFYFAKREEGTRGTANGQES